MNDTKIEAGQVYSENDCPTNLYELIGSTQGQALFEAAPEVGAEE